MHPFLSHPNFRFIRTVLILAACALFCASSVQPARADAAPPPDPTVGSAGPYKPQKTNVQMLAETVLIDISRQQWPDPKSQESPKVRVSASFNMRNQGQTEEKMQVIFPLTQLSQLTEEDSVYNLDGKSFVVKVDGQSVPVTEITTPSEKGYELEYDAQSGEPTHGFYPAVRWAAFDVTFPVHKNVRLQVEYDMFANPDDRYATIEYILETGAGWYGPIISADLSMRLPYPAVEDLIQYANPGYSLVGNEIRWHLKNIEPTRKDNLKVSVISPEIWQNILDLRSKAAQTYRDAETWSKLGDAYMDIATGSNMINSSSFYINNDNLIDRALKAYQQALIFRPDWSYPHYKIAEIGWAQNATRTNLQLEDPAIQHMLKELQLGWSSAVKDEEINDLLQEINAHIPGLNLSLLAFPTAITPSPTATLHASAQTPAAQTPTQTATPQPTATATQAPPTAVVTPEIVDARGVSMRSVPGGRIQTASGREVYLDAFQIDQYEVTNALYKACVAAGKCARPKQTYSFTRPAYYGSAKFENYPVVDVDWNMAKAYCAWRGARLPSDAEWEMAARDTSGQIYPWGAAIDKTYANYNQDVGDTSPVGSYEKGKSSYGVYDLSGNVWEWVLDYTEQSDSSAVDKSLLGPTNFWRVNSQHWIRGGSWYNTADVLDVSRQFFPAPPNYASLLIGFRCARSIPPVPGSAAPQVTSPAAKAITDEKGVSMRSVPAGDFSMGSANGDLNEQPVHTVHLDAYTIDQYEVTNALYKACVTAGGCKINGPINSSATIERYYGNPKFDQYPVVSVSWEMAKAYCEWRGARLPSEAEWEKAARGSDGRTYPWGDGLDASYANFDQNDTSPVGSYPKGQSVYGVYDLAGNVWEWVNDWYAADYYQASPAANPTGPDTGEFHVLKGGSWYFSDLGLRSAYRSAAAPDYTRPTIGFRCARSLP
jgi:formylglycine-generating enzyme required for sulfatase activity